MGTELLITVILGAVLLVVVTILVLRRSEAGIATSRLGRMARLMMVFANFEENSHSSSIFRAVVGSRAGCPVFAP